MLGLGTWCLAREDSLNLVVQEGNALTEKKAFVHLS